MGDRRRSPMRGPPRGRGGPPPALPPERSGYKVLCVSSLHPKASDDVVRDTLYREYKKYGDISVRVMHEPDERVAYVYFRNFEDARDAKHSKSRIILFDKPAIVEAVYESASREEYESRGGGRPHSLSPPPHHPRGGGYGRDSMGGGYGRGPATRSPDRYSRDEMYRDDWGDRRGGPLPPLSSRGPPPRRDDYRSGPRGGGHHGGGGHHRDDYRGPPHGGGGGHRGGGPRGGSAYSEPGYGGAIAPSRRENKKDKFPNYLDHLMPEDDPLATRTLFAGNLELNITDEEMKRIFGRYGELVDIDIKRPPPGTGNAYAFIRFANLDQAALAKRELSGQYIGKFQCKIGYGKVNATTKVWVGGLGGWTSLSMLEREFDRFGAIQKIDYKLGGDEAFIQYESIDAAQAAVNEMRGFALGGPEKRIRMDFADVENMPPPRGYQGSDYDPAIARASRGGTGDLRGPRGGRGGYYRGGAPAGGGGGGRNDYNQRGGGGGGGYDDWGKRPGDDLDGPPSRIRKMDTRSPDMDENGIGGMDGSKTITDLAKRINKVWEGGLILKNSLFPTKLLLTEGEIQVVDQLLKDENDRPHLKITQRLRLDQTKLEDVSKRITSSSSHAIFLALSLSSTQIPQNTHMPDVLSRPLKNLVSYLKQKEAAGVITLQNPHSEQTGVLYAFPPCQFSLELLRRAAPGLCDEGGKDDHLVVVVVRGG